MDAVQCSHGLTIGPGSPVLPGSPGSPGSPGRPYRRVWNGSGGCGMEVEGVEWKWRV